MARAGTDNRIAALVGVVAVAVVAALAVGVGRMAYSAPPPRVDPVGPLPRFESLRADKVYLRTGPGGRYPIEWVYVRRGLPVEILLADEHWRKIRDWQGSTGWVHEKMVWPHREVIVTGGIRLLHRNPGFDAPVIARVEPGVIGRLEGCAGAWCRIEAGDYTGWVRRGDVWGVFANEAAK
ncbi:MAG: SH3 domain-containing protein [Stellaceae bacterium]